MIVTVGCFLLNCYGTKSVKKTIVYPDKIETENYVICRDTTELPNWSNYHESIVRYERFSGSLRGPSLTRYGFGPWSSDGKGIYLDIVPDNRYFLVFENITSDRETKRKWGSILVKNETFSKTTELLVSSDHIGGIFPGGIYRVYGFENHELILKTYYFIKGRD